MQPLRTFRRQMVLTVALLVAANLACAVDAVPAFGAGSKLPERQFKPGTEVHVPIDCLSPERAALWIAETPQAGQTAPPFSISAEDGKPVLHIATARCEPGKTTIRALLPGDSADNGKLWAKAKATHVSFLYRATGAAQLTMHLLVRGKTAGTHTAGFGVEPGALSGEWQRVLLPVGDFEMNSFSTVAGLGFRVASADPGCEIQLRDFGVCSLPLTDDAWKSQRLQISIDGQWHFAGDAADHGFGEGWFKPAFDDSTWQVLKSGTSWQEQGVALSGYGWYRQKLFIPKECAGTPLRLTLAPMPSDDDTWFNGERIGGFSGEYKYTNWLTRVYTVPPALIHYGEENSIAIRMWGGDITFIGNKSGLIKGPLVAELDPYALRMRAPGSSESVAAELFDLSAAQQGAPFEMLAPFPAELLASTPGAVAAYQLSDANGKTIATGKAPLAAIDNASCQAVIAVGRDAAQQAYLRGRLRLSLQIENNAGEPVYAGVRELDHLNFGKRDALVLPTLPDSSEDTPYGKLRLIDEIDAGTPTLSEIHPYVQSGFGHEQDRLPPGSPVAVQVHDILGKPARESATGWFAYRVGRGKLKPRGTYLLRIEYPEDKARNAPIEIQTGQNFMDVGWKNGVGANDPYDNWPLSQKWQWYDVVVPLDDTTMGMGGTGTAAAENGFWVYFMNKVQADKYYAMYDGGPAVGRIRLYELDPEKNAPVIRRPQGVPNRVLQFDWERQPDHQPADLVRYAKLMGYSAISPVIIKWSFANYSEPLNGYMSVNIDAHDYWAKQQYDPKDGKPAAPAVPGKPSTHVRYLEATKQYGIDYIPRFEWGGSMDLPESARAIDENGKPAKPNRFADWCCDLLQPAAWDDLKRLMDHLVGQYAADNPQLKGALWRIRCDRMPISYSKDDLALFSKETGATLPAGGYEQRAAWAAREGKEQYDTWWHQKRAQFHIKLAQLLQSYRPDMTLSYYNWDPDKFGLINVDLGGWNFLATVVKPAPEGGKNAYLKEREQRQAFTAEDYISVMHSGNFGAASKGINRADYGIRPELYRDVKGLQIFAPANYLCYADKPAYLEYFRTGDGVAVSNVVSYDEVGSRSINPKYEGNMLTPGGPAFSMAIELLAWFHSDARTLTYTVYTYGRGFADAHRRFAQAYLALPAVSGTVVDQGDADVKVRTYETAGGTYVGVAHKGYSAKQLTITIPAKPGAMVVDQVSGQTVPSELADGHLRFTVAAGPMELDAYLVR